MLQLKLNLRVRSSNRLHLCVCRNRWRINGMQNCNPEQIMLSAVAQRSGQDVNIMKEKLIFSGAALPTYTWVFCAYDWRQLEGSKLIYRLDTSRTILGCNEKQMQSKQVQDVCLTCYHRVVLKAKIFSSVAVRSWGHIHKAS